MFGGAGDEKKSAAVELVAEAIRRARSREPREGIGGSRWQAGTAKCGPALRAGYEFLADGAIPEHAIAAYNETHPDRPTDAQLIARACYRRSARDKEWLQLVETSPRNPQQEGCQVGGMNDAALLVRVAEVSQGRRVTDSERRAGFGFSNPTGGNCDWQAGCDLCERNAQPVVVGAALATLGGGRGPRLQ